MHPAGCQQALSAWLAAYPHQQACSASSKHKQKTMVACDDVWLVLLLLLMRFLVTRYI